ncbi:MAG: hypothetical protein GY928_33985 [Colwellia sp.]|nr:hypothetical protein [Colwellia sp.]
MSEQTENNVKNEVIKPMDLMEILQVNAFELMKLYSELTEAYYGVNSYGGNIAEIYMYRLKNYNPTIHSKSKGKHKKKEVERLEMLCARQLVGLVKLFCKERHCTANINGSSPDDFLRESQADGDVFNIRVKVEIFNQDKAQPESLGIEDVTHLVEVGQQGDEHITFLKCVCGAKYEHWDFLLSIYREDPNQCAKCFRWFYYTTDVKVFQVVNYKEDDSD